jgi:hypothetical protein
MIASVIIAPFSNSARSISFVDYDTLWVEFMQGKVGVITGI